MLRGSRRRGWLKRALVVRLAILLLLSKLGAQAENAVSVQQGNNGTVVNGNNNTINAAPAPPVVVYDARVLECISEKPNPLSWSDIGPPFPMFSEELPPRSQISARLIAEGKGFDQTIHSAITPQVVAQVASTVKEDPTSGVQLFLDSAGRPAGDYTDPQVETFMTLRHWFSLHDQDYNSIGSKYGSSAEEAFREVEGARDSLSSGFPNRVLVVRFQNDEPEEANDLAFVVTTQGRLYDAIVADEQYQTGENEQRLSVKVAALPPRGITEARVWYYWRFLAQDEEDFSWARNEGITVTNIRLGHGQLEQKPLNFDDLHASKTLGDPLVVKRAGL